MLSQYAKEPRNIEISIPWDSNTFRGFVGALCVTTILMLLLPFIISIEIQPFREQERRSIPITLIWGDGDGTGARKGNLQEQGKAVKGRKTQNPLEDAKIAATMKTVTKDNPLDYVSGAAVKPEKNIASTTPSTDTLRASGSKSIGTENGSSIGSGLSEVGFGTGSGKGYGDIEWGGGGNRVVLNKVIPRYPPGINTSAIIKLRFTVRPNGTVEAVMPMQKGDPALEQAAMVALRQWRFNPLSTEINMVGVIPFYFKVQ